MFTHLFHRPSTGLHNRRVALAAIVLGSVLLSLNGCGNLKKYDVTFNDRAVYSPQTLFDDYRINDKALANCIEQAIEDFEVYTITGLEILNCSDAGINSLVGLSQFRGLKRVKLSGNNIRNLVELSVMTQLVDIQLDGNRVVDSVPLASLPRLKQINLFNNPLMQCNGLAKFRTDVQVTRPEHCPS